MNTFHAIVDTATSEICSSHPTWCEAVDALEKLDGPEQHEIWLAGDNDKLLFSLTSDEPECKPDCETGYIGSHGHLEDVLDEYNKSRSNSFPQTPMPIPAPFYSIDELAPQLIPIADDGDHMPF